MNIKEEPREVPYIATVPPEALDLVIESDEEITRRKIVEGMSILWGDATTAHDLIDWLDSEDK